MDKSDTATTDERHRRLSDQVLHRLFLRARTRNAFLPKPIHDELVRELYDLTKDFSQGHDLAKAEPAKLKEMEELWWAEAGRNNALPLNFSPQATVEAIFQRPSLTRGRNHFVYRQGTVR